ncbi:MAG TPA: UDP-N-acetylmuramate dehydrogenase [Dietzia timorensis]|uniref:UDP-N-acetylenolpyruvoylglucosamine reductase n=1 Tax=Dietzia timorensis TaxID=499555 RepID=A0A921JY77_9ACTN|nr:UDP-N-acetylmuramate dehydrogenase [Dietzia timorensis]
MLANEPLSAHTTLRLGGTPRAYLRAETTEAVVECVRALDAAGVPVLVLGGGSNLVVADGSVGEPGDDGGLGFVVVAVRCAAIDISPGGVVRAEAGVTWDELVARTVEAGMGGLECLSGIPGSVGATPVQNVGAYGVEVAQVLRRVRVLDRVSGEDAWLEPSELGLAYRTSKLKGNDSGVVLEVEFTLRPDGLSEPIAYRELAARLGAEQGERVPAAKAREVVLELRGGKGMVLDAEDHDTWSAGSFFTNPVVPAAEFGAVRAKVAKALGDEAAEKMPAFDVMGGGSGSGVKLSAGWLIERAGFAKGYPGEAAPMRLSTKHTLALTNRGSARTKDLIALAREVRAGVEDAFGVTLHPEPVWVGCTLSGES